MNKLILSFFSFILFSLQIKSQNPSDINYIKSAISYSSYYSFLDTAYNYIQYHSPDAIGPFFEKLKNSDKHKVRILHIGDSHLQSDIGASNSRNILQDVFGFAGRGSVFPYTIANTHATYDYEVKKQGSWQRRRNIDTFPVFDLGVTGITARTYDSTAGFEINFIKDRAKIQSTFRKLKLFCYTGMNSFDCEYRLGVDEPWKLIKCHKLTEGKSCIEIDLPHEPSSIQIRMLKSNPSQAYFEIHGLYIESTEEKGFLYNSVGINGAKLKSFLKENLFEFQIAEFSPDLVILDLIANDLAYGDFNQVEIKNYLDSSVDKIRSASPKAAIMIVGMQDIYLKGRNVINAGLYSPFLRSYALSKKVSFYDYYLVSGGPHSMKKWSANGLSAKDMCHLSTAGYILKGELFANAIMNSYLHYLGNPEDSLIIHKFSGIEEMKDSTSERDDVVKQKSEKPIQPGQKPKNITSKKIKTYKVKKGDSIFSIAKKFNLTQKELSNLNKLKNSNLKIGQVLKISK